MARVTQGGPTGRTRPVSSRKLGVIVLWEVALAAALLLVFTRAAWAYALAAVLILIALLLTVPVNGRSLTDTVAMRRRFAERTRAHHVVDQAGDMAPLVQAFPMLGVVHTRDAAGGEIGLLHDGSAWVAVLEVTSDDLLVADRWSEIDLRSLGTLSRQDDLVFSGVQVLTVTVPAPSQSMLTPGSPALDAYLGIVGLPETPPAIRRTWVAVRLDPALCVQAVARRGADTVGVFAALRIGVHRAQTLLKRQGVATATLSPEELTEVLSLATVPSPEPPEERSVETWEEWTCDGLIHRTRGIRGFGADPSKAYQALLDVAAQSPAVMVVTACTVSPDGLPRGAVRQVSLDAAQASAADAVLLDRVGSAISLGSPGGTQVPGLLATLPLGRQVDA